MGLDDGITELKDALDDASAEEVAEALEENLSSVYKAIRNPAFKAGQEAKDADVKSAQEKIASLRKEKKSLQEQVNELEEGQPEAAEIRGKYEEKMKGLQEQIEALKSEKQETEKTWREKTKGVKTQTAQERIASHLKSLGVDSDYADFKAQQIVGSGRVQVTDDDLSVQFYEDEDGTVPFHHNGEAPAERAFAEEQLSSIPDKFISDERPGSTGLGETNGRRSSGVTLTKEEARDPKKYRQAKKAAQEAGQEAPTIVD